MRYRNAVEVLPDEILKEVQRYHCGLLWVPKPRNIERDELIRSLARKGVPVNEIAGLASLTPRRVRQILGLDKKNENSFQISMFDAL